VVVSVFALLSRTFVLAAPVGPRLGMSVSMGSTTADGNEVVVSVVGFVPMSSGSSSVSVVADVFGDLDVFGCAMSVGPYVFKPLDFLGYAAVVGAIVVVGAYVFEPLDFLGYAMSVGAYVSEPLDFFGYAEVEGAYVFEPLDFFGYAEVVGAYVFEPLDFFGYAEAPSMVGAIVTVGAYVFEPLDFFGYAEMEGTYVFEPLDFFGYAVVVGAYVFEPFEDFFVFWEKLILSIPSLYVSRCLLFLNDTIVSSTSDTDTAFKGETLPSDAALPMSTEANAITKTLDDNMIKSVI